MKGKIHIDILQEDIDKGEAGDCRLCPAALAIGRVTKEQHVEVWGMTVFLGPEKYIGATPDDIKKLKDFVDAFDKSRPVQPVSFDLERI